MSYSQALEKQVAMLDFIDSGRFRDYAERFLMPRIPNYPGRDICNATYGMLEAAQPYWCARSIDEMIEQTAASLPSNAVLTADMLPSPNGFLWLAWPFRSREEGRGTFAAIAWAHHDALVVPEDGIDTGPLAWVQLFVPENHAPGVGFWPLFNHPWPYGKSPEEATRFMVERGLFGVEDAARSIDSLAWPFRWFLALLVFMQQRILTSPQQRVERHTRKRLERDGFVGEPLVRVVELRRRQSRSEHHDQAEPVDWSHRWVVGGHWRQQWYPSLDAHQPRWIMPHVKGPDDKPLKPPRATVFAVVR